VKVIENLRRVLRSNVAEYTYECKSCGQSFELQHQVCPSCGGFSVERVEWSNPGD
jgi:rRNA maturation endonuclease Nob1